MNSKIAEQGVVIVIIQDGDKFLFQLNPKWNDLSFIGGKIESSDKSPLDAAYRECEEELDIKRNTDYELSPLPPGIFQEQKMSKRTGKLTNYTFHIFILKPKRNIDKKLNALGNI
ncbi:MAG: NUDIX hydrolase [Leptospiraceae bacterium]|nr:NUDIX hydrolase [Leptospiraceae bacterium]